MANNRNEVDQLLGMYQNYKSLLEQQSEVSLKLARSKLLKSNSNQLEALYEKLKSEIQIVSDSMTFANPIIWMMYKFEAYQNEAQPIRTMHDFRVHCSKPGYICTKRFTFLNDQLESTGNSRLTDKGIYPDDMLLNEVFSNEQLGVLSGNADFSRLWNKYEFYKSGATAAKWENYSRESAIQA